MIDNSFSEGYKKVLLDTEGKIKNLGFKETKELDVLIEIINKSEGTLKEIFAIYGLNEKIILEIITKTGFSTLIENRKGNYTGMSPILKETLLLSVKIAADFEKNKASTEDFIIALLKQKSWFVNILDFVGINPEDLENHIIEVNKKGSIDGRISKESETDVGIDKILGALTDNILGGQGLNIDEQNNESNPFDISKNQQKKSDSNTPALDFFATNLTEEAKEGKLDTVIGRDNEIERLIAILNRKTKNNPVLVGEPGVGKTAVVEGLANKIAKGEVPISMRDKKILALDMSSLVAGTKYRGEFETRIKQIIEEASKVENEVIIFIDEIHTIIGAGGSEGTLDASNILKPAMGRGKICMIGATTLNEYQKYIEKDSALERRFQQIILDEPNNETANEIIRGLKKSFEEYHNLIITDEAISEAVNLSTRYITDKFLPDKAIDLIDEACSLKSMKYNVNEEQIIKIKEKISNLNKQIESAVITQSYQKAASLKAKQKEYEKEISSLKKQFNIPREKRFKVIPFDIQKVLSISTGIPTTDLSRNEIQKLKSLPKEIKSNVIGQDEAIDNVVYSIMRSKAGIASPNKPVGSFLFLGPTGVGKTELVKVLAKTYYGNEKSLIRIDMSEYNDKTGVNKLIGASAGYVGYEEGGQLTEKVRKNPYSIVLFDEIEKADFEIYNLLLQILDEGELTDSKGRKVNFKNTIVIMTSNIGQEEFNNKAEQIGFDVSESEEEKAIDDFEKAKEAIKGNLSDYFSPEFINRIDKVIVFNPLDKKAIRKIVKLSLDELSKRIETKGIELEYDNKVLNLITKEVYNPEFGAREIRRFVQDKIEDNIANILILGKGCDKISLTVNKGELQIES